MFPGIRHLGYCSPSVLLVAGVWLLPLHAQEGKKDGPPEIEPRAVLFAKDGAPHRVVLTPDNKTLISACQAFGGVVFWDVDKKEARPRQPGHTGRGVHGLALSPNGKTVASGGFSDRKVFLWDVASGKTTKELGEHQERVIVAHFTPDGKKLLTASREGDIKVWDVETGKEIAALFGRKQNIEQVDLSPDGRFLALYPGTRGATVTLWDMATDKALLTLDGLPGNQGVGPVRFSPDGKHVVVAWGNTEPKLGFWDAATGRSVRSINLPTATNALAFSPDGKRFATPHGRDIRLWDVATGMPVATFVENMGNEGLVFSPDGKTLAAGGRDQRIRLWDVPSPSAKSLRDKEK
jgi:WD40 repeat protein